MKPDFFLRFFCAAVILFSAQGFAAAGTQAHVFDIITLEKQASTEGKGSAADRFKIIVRGDTETEAKKYAAERIAELVKEGYKVLEEKTSSDPAYEQAYEKVKADSKEKYPAEMDAEKSLWKLTRA